MTLKQAVGRLGGLNEAARLIGVPRTSLAYWLKKSAPKWREPDVRRLKELAALAAVAEEQAA